MRDSNPAKIITKAVDLEQEFIELVYELQSCDDEEILLTIRLLLKDKKSLGSCWRLISYLGQSLLGRLLPDLFHTGVLFTLNDLSEIHSIVKSLDINETRRSFRKYLQHMVYPDELDFDEYNIVNLISFFKVLDMEEDLSLFMNDYCKDHVNKEIVDIYQDWKNDM